MKWGQSWVCFMLEKPPLSWLPVKGGWSVSQRTQTCAPRCGLDSFFQPTITRFVIAQTPQRAAKGNKRGIIPEKSLLAAPVRITQLSYTFYGAAFHTLEPQPQALWVKTFSALGIKKTNKQTKNYTEKRHLSREGSSSLKTTVQ